MQNTLFLLCPTDCLESIVNDTFRNENYFYTSLGNSFTLNFESSECIKALITKHHINEIYFVLSNDNKIILDALGRQNFSKISGLKKCYKDVTKQKEHVEVLWQNDTSQFSIISYYLNKRIEKLKFELEDFQPHPIKIGGKIFDTATATFNTIYSNLICLERTYLN